MPGTAALSPEVVQSGAAEAALNRQVCNLPLQHRRLEGFNLEPGWRGDTLRFNGAAVYNTCPMNADSSLIFWSIATKRVTGHAE
jgi:hypothetical protein